MTREQWLQRYADRWISRGYKLAMDVEKYASAFRAWGKEYADNPEKAADIMVQQWEGKGPLLRTIVADRSSPSHL